MDLQTRGSFQMHSKEMQKAGVFWEAGVWGFGRIADAGIDRQRGHVSPEETLHKSHQGEKISELKSRYVERAWHFQLRRQHVQAELLQTCALITYYHQRLGRGWDLSLQF